MNTQGRWVVTTSSGARYVLDSSDPSRVTATRIRENAASNVPGFPLRSLRRDSAAVRVLAIQHDPEHGLNNGVRIGHDMWLHLQPLADGAVVTVRRSTPVVSIDEVPEEGPDE